MDSLDAQSSRLQALVFVIALSTHSFLEGLGMAAKNDQRGLTLYVAGGLCFGCQCNECVLWSGLRMHSGGLLCLINAIGDLVGDAV